MVAVLDTIEDYLEDIVDTLYEIYGWIDEIPIVGDYLSPLFYDFYYAGWYVVSYFSDFNDWCDNLYENVETALSDIVNISKDITDITKEIAGFLTWENIVEGLLGIYDTIDDWFNAQEEKVLNWVVDSFEWILDKVFKE